MNSQFLTDEVMLDLSTVMLILVGAFAVLFLRRDGFRSIWWLLCLSLFIPQLLITLGYYVAWIRPESPADLFPSVAILTRPGLLGVYLFILLVIYIIYQMTDHVTKYDP